MSRIPPRLARRIDRLARAGHRFHRYAHHPLCGRYGTEVVRVGRRGRVCLGCLMAGTGLAVGAAAGLAVTLPLSVPLAAGGIGVGLAGASLVSGRRPVPAAPRRRWAKLFTRALPGAALALATAAGLRLALTGHPAFGLGLAAGGALALAAAVLGYRRRTPDRTPCATCPEAAGPGPCSGVAPLVRRERAIQRLVGRWLDGAGL